MSRGSPFMCERDRMRVDLLLAGRMGNLQPWLLPYELRPLRMRPMQKLSMPLLEHSRSGVRPPGWIGDVDHGTRWSSWRVRCPASGLAFTSCSRIDEPARPAACMRHGSPIQDSMIGWNMPV